MEKAYGDPEKLRMLAERVYGECRAEGEFSVIVTGCSHYAHLAPYFPCKVYDGAEGVARRLLSLIGSSRNNHRGEQRARIAAATASAFAALSA